MHIPTRVQAMALLREGERRNPGPWVAHSLSNAENASLIAARCPQLDADAAYVMGLLHDIGRREGPKAILHLFDGYDYLRSLGYDDAAVICLTHSFPNHDASSFTGKVDCSKEQFAFLQDFIQHHHFTDYDRLIQLCDAISMSTGAVILEKRLLEVTQRHGFNDWTLRKWGAFFELKQAFDALAQCNIYTLLPNLFENTIA